MRKPLAFAFALALLATPALADTVVLNDGRRVSGRTSFEGDEVVVKVKHGEVRFKKVDVRTIEKEDDVYSQYERKQKELQDGTGDDRYALGVWSREHNLDAEARSAFLSVLKIEPDHAGARAALGYVKGDDGRWITEDDLNHAKGLVKFEGRWVTPAEKVKAELEQQEKRVKAREAVKKAEEDRVAARKAKYEAEREARLARIAAYEEELAHARARRAAEEEAEDRASLSGGFSTMYYGGYSGFYGGWRSYWVGPNVGNAEAPYVYAIEKGLVRRPTYYRTPTYRLVTVPDFNDYGYGCGPVTSFGSGGSYSQSSSSDSYGFGVSLSGSYTSRSGRTQIRFRTGF